MKLYAIPFIEKFKPLFSSHCWGSECGKAAIGALDLGGVQALVCSEETCPILDKQSDEAVAEDNDGNAIHFRALKVSP